MSTIDRVEEGIPQQPSYPSPQIHHQKKISFISSNPHPVPGPEMPSSDPRVKIPRRSLANLQYRPTDGQDGQPGTPVYPYAHRPSQPVIRYPVDVSSKKKKSLRKKNPILFNILSTIFVMALVSIVAGVGYFLYARNKK
ncbi:Hypothetical protein NTJ_15846 [Nesidiocoris tenuis]|uniref:Uncharacterized protein n=1 Tax=Nesidiocoris tenuis TaxID=355587 RepID=A0ABN7BIE2_9HEMI|nr:Hypothetical protein NTJ_15846 [Nesidiocoris tenuis]